MCELTLCIQGEVKKFVSRKLMCDLYRSEAAVLALTNHPLLTFVTEIHDPCNEFYVPSDVSCNDIDRNCHNFVFCEVARN